MISGRLRRHRRLSLSETLFRFLVSELTSLRIICRHNDCGAVVELRLDHLSALDVPETKLTCPACRNVIERGSSSDKIVTNLAKAILKFKNAADYVDVEFTLPVKPEARP